MTAPNTTPSITPTTRPNRWLTPALALATLALVIGISVIVYQALHVEWYTPYTPKPFEYRPDETHRMRLAVRLAFLGERPALEAACEKSFRAEDSAPLFAFASTCPDPGEKAYAYGMICSFQRQDDLERLMALCETAPAEAAFGYPAMLLAPNNKTVEWYLRGLSSDVPVITALSQACLLAFALDQGMQSQSEWQAWWKIRQGDFLLSDAPHFQRAAACYEYFRFTQRPAETPDTYWESLASLQWFLEGRHFGEIDRMFEEGNRLFWSGKIDEAVVWYDNCLKKNPNSLRAHGMLAHCAVARGDKPQALAHAKQLQIIDPGSAYGQWLERFATCSAMGDDFFDSVPFFSLEESIVIETDPNLTAALQLAAARRGEYELVSHISAAMDRQTAPQFDVISLLKACFNPLSQHHAVAQAKDFFADPVRNAEALSMAYFFALLAAGAGYEDTSGCLQRYRPAFPDNTAWTVWSCLLGTEADYSSFVNLGRKLKTGQPLFRWNERTLAELEGAFFRSAYQSLLPEIAREFLPTNAVADPGLALDALSTIEKIQGQLVSLAAQSLGEAALQALRDDEPQRAWLLLRMGGDLLSALIRDALFLPTQTGAARLRLSLLMRIKPHAPDFSASTQPLFEFMLLEAQEQNEYFEFMTDAMRRDPCMLRLSPCTQRLHDASLSSGQRALLARRLAAHPNPAGESRDQ